MAARRTKSANSKPGTRSQFDVLSKLRKALSGRLKSELVDLVIEFARADVGIMRKLKARFEIVAGPAELVAATRRAIQDATDFDDREINTNFDYDHQAYEEVKRNFARLVESGQLKIAMELAVELMKEGSRQVELSDEGMMADDIEECVEVVVRAVKASDLPAKNVDAWSRTMLAGDRVQCIACDSLRSLQKLVQKR